MADVWKPVFAPSSKAAKYKGEAGLLGSVHETIKHFASDKTDSKKPERHDDVISLLHKTIRTNADKKFIKGRYSVSFLSRQYTKMKERPEEMLELLKQGPGGRDLNITAEQIKAVGKYQAKYGKFPDTGKWLYEDIRSDVENGIEPLAVRGKDGKWRRNSVDDMVMKRTGEPWQKTLSDVQARKIQAAQETVWIRDTVRDYFIAHSGKINTMAMERDVTRPLLKGKVIDKRMAQRLRMQALKTTTAYERGAMGLRTQKQLMQIRALNMLDQSTEREGKALIESYNKGETTLTDMRGKRFAVPVNDVKWQRMLDAEQRKMLSSVWDSRPTVKDGDYSRPNPMPLDVPYAVEYSDAIWNASKRRAREMHGLDLGGMLPAQAHAIVKSYTKIRSNNQGRRLMQVASQIGMGAEEFAGALVSPEKVVLPQGLLENLRNNAGGLDPAAVKAFKNRFYPKEKAAAPTQNKKTTLERIQGVLRTVFPGYGAVKKAAEMAKKLTGEGKDDNIGGGKEDGTGDDK